MAEIRDVPYEISLRGEELGIVSVEEYANFLRDFVFIHDRLWFIATKKFLEYDITTSFYYTRKGRPLPPEHRLLLRRAHMGSPFDFDIVIQSAKEVAQVGLTLFLLVEGLLLVRGKRRIQDLQEQKLRQDSSSPTVPSPRARESLPEGLLVPGEEFTRRLLDQNISLPKEQEEKMAGLLYKDVRRIKQNRLVITEIVVTKTVSIETEEDKEDGPNKPT